VSAPVLPILDDVVIIQDRFPAENFAHFLFDWITRIGLFLDFGLEGARQCLFVMGGILDEFRSLLLEAITNIYGIRPEQLFFPEDALRLKTSGTTYWFSDQVETYMHPAQMAHPKSVEIIRKVAKAISIEDGPFERIYISRGDTGRRRVSNENEIWQQLRP